MHRFIDRTDAGKQLAEKLLHYKNSDHAVVLGIPRGGVVVGYEVARALQAPLEVFIVRKLGVPGYEELAMGAIGSGGVLVLNSTIMRMYAIDEETLENVGQKELRELERREREYRGNRGPIPVAGRTAILVDDGLATGASMKAAVEALKRRHPARIVVAVPTAPPEVCEEFKNLVDEAVCVITPAIFYGVGAWYLDFRQVSDEEVRDVLQRASRENLILEQEYENKRTA